MWYIIGGLAAGITTFAFVPQIIKIVKTRSVKDVSLITLLLFGLGVSLWIAYGVHLKDPIIITANSISLTTVLIMVFLFFRHR
jgi:MtN3 and saliva related transmembrane protein